MIILGFGIVMPDHLRVDPIYGRIWINPDLIPKEAASQGRFLLVPVRSRLQLRNTDQNIPFITDHNMIARFIAMQTDRKPGPTLTTSSAKGFLLNSYEYEPTCGFYRVSNRIKPLQRPLQVNITGFTMAKFREKLSSPVNTL